MSLETVRPGPLAALHAAGYDPQTVDEALDAAAKYLAADRNTAAIWVLGARDLVDLDQT